MRFVVVRPEPGLSATMARLRKAGHDAIALPLFAVAPISWTPPPLAPIDALLVTSANAMRHGGVELTALRHLPVVAVGQASAAAARAAGFTVAAAGSGDAAAAAALARRHGFDRILHLAGRDRIALPGVDAVTVYASDAIEIDPAATACFLDATILIHSPRAARRVAVLADRDRRDRTRIAIAALSNGVADAAGAGWRAMRIAAAPDDDALVAVTNIPAARRD